MKALILAAGRGRRLQDGEDDLNKCMHTFNGKYLIQYSLESAILSEVEEIVIVVGYQAESIVNAFGISYEDRRIRYVLQSDLKGPVDAMEQAREALEGDDFFLFLGDEILCDPHPAEMVRLFHEEELFAVCGVTQVVDIDTIRKTYAVLYNPFDHRIYRLIEKPRNPTNSFMGTGNCVFRNGILDYISCTPVNQIRNEKELPDLIQCAIDDGNSVKLFPLASGYVNVNTADDALIAENFFREGCPKWKDRITVLP